MDILFRFWCNVNCHCIYDNLRPKLDFIFSFINVHRKYRLSHRWADLINSFVYKILDRFLPEEGKSKCWWVYIMGRTEDEWHRWYLENE